MAVIVIESVQYLPSFQPSAEYQAETKALALKLIAEAADLPAEESAARLANAGFCLLGALKFYAGAMVVKGLAETQGQASGELVREVASRVQTASMLDLAEAYRRIVDAAAPVEVPAPASPEPPLPRGVEGMALDEVALVLAGELVAEGLAADERAALYDLYVEATSREATPTHNGLLSAFARLIAAPRAVEVPTGRLLTVLKAKR
jgi:hypothetical protein